MTRHYLKFFADLSLWSIALPIAYILRLEGQIGRYAEDIIILTLFMIPFKGIILYSLKFHLQSWHKLGVWDLYQIVTAVLFLGLFFFILAFFLGPEIYLPRSVPLIEAIVSVMFLSGVRLATRIIHERKRLVQAVKSKRKRERVLIAGAGESGTMLAREIRRHPQAMMELIGFLDDNPAKEKEWFLGYEVLGRLDDLPEIVKERGIDKVIIAMPTASGEIVRKVVRLAQEVKIKYQIMPGLFDLLSGKFSISQLREVSMEDLLRREQVDLDFSPISNYLNNRTILVTGAGGSIGSEIVRQIIAFGPRHLLLLGRGENSIFGIEQELLHKSPQIPITSLITDVRDRKSLELIFQKFRPQVIFHAAAHKHVPLMESNPCQAILNNVEGTKNIVDLSIEYGVERFVNVSTDKAVNPTSVMGASKRVAEYVVQRASLKVKNNQCYVSVRFGNVLESRGSVIPLFKEQIKNGGPITITHPEMTRYFMTIPEASQLMLQAGGLGENGSVYVLDMGHPVKIVDMASDLIRLSGLIPGEDIEISYIGVRPGEKLFEELLTAEEGTMATHYAKIFTAKTGIPLMSDFDQTLNKLFNAARTGDDEVIRSLLKKMVSTYTCNVPDLTSEEKYSKGSNGEPARRPSKK